MERWFLEPAAMHAAVAQRIVFGLLLFLCYLLRLPEFDLVYRAESIAWDPSFRSFAPNFVGLYAPGLPLDPVVEMMSGLSSSALGLALALAYGILLITSASFALGLLTRISGSCALLLHGLFQSINPFAYWGWAGVMAPFLLYVLLTPCGRYFSLDALLRSRRLARPMVPIDEWRAPAWPLRLIQVHVSLMYFFTGFARIDNPGWLSGHMMFEALTFSVYSRIAIDWLPLKPLLEALSYIAFVLEPAAPFLLWIPLIGPLCALALILMHVMLEITTGVDWWNLLMIGGLLAFLPTPWLAAVFRTPSRLLASATQEPK